MSGQWIFLLPAGFFATWFLVELFRDHKRNKRIKEAVSRDKWEVERD